MMALSSGLGVFTMSEGETAQRTHTRESGNQGERREGRAGSRRSLVGVSWARNPDPAGVARGQRDPSASQVSGRSALSSPTPDGLLRCSRGVCAGARALAGGRLLAAS